MNDQSLVSRETRDRLRGFAVPVATGLGRLGLTPNSLTVLGFAGTAAAGVAAAFQLWFVAGVLVIAFGIFDLFDGALARATGRASTFGAFLDSTLDRTGESLVLAGVAIGCAAAGFVEGVAAAALALTFASSVTYARARAESVGLHGEVGVAPRPERLLLLSGGLVLSGLMGGIARDDGGLLVLLDAWSGGRRPLFVALGLIAVLSAVTVVQRILHTKRQLDRQNSNE